MAIVPESPDWGDGVYRVETTDKVLGGADGKINVQAGQLASRTKYLKQAIEAVDVKATEAIDKADDALAQIGEAVHSTALAHQSAQDAYAYKTDAIAAAARAGASDTSAHANAVAASESAAYSAESADLARTKSAQAAADASLASTHSTASITAKGESVAARDIALGARDSAQQSEISAKADAVLATDRCNAAISAFQGAEEARKMAESARDAAVLSKGLYQDIASGLAGVGEGEYFSVPSADSKEFLILYRKLQGAANESKKYPSYAAIQTLVETVVENTDTPIFRSSGSDVADYVLAFVDSLNKAACGINSNGDFVASVLRVIESLNVGGTELYGGGSNYDFAITDQDDKVVVGLPSGGLFSFSGGVSIGSELDVLLVESDCDFAIVDSSDRLLFYIKGGVPSFAIGSSSDGVSGRNLINIQKSRSVKGVISSSIARNVYKYNHIIVYGQSLSTGHEGWPALSKTAKYGNLMLGDCVRPNTTSGASFIPFGGNALKPLIANVQNGGSILTDAEVAALAPGNGALGEVVNQGLVNFAKRLHNDYLIRSNDVERLFVTTNNGVSGRTIEQLSKGASPEEYKRVTDSVSIIKSVAASEGVTYGVTGIVWMQGEYNYATTWGGVDDKDGYKAKLVTLRNNLNSDISSVTGQDRPPAFFTYQTGAGYTVDTNGLAVGMAQWEFCRENPGCYLAGPIYPYTDKGGHLDSNGYRWFGNLLGKVFHRVVTLGQNWKPLAPTKIDLSDRTILIDFNVPEPPLVFDLPYVVNSTQNYTNKGFTVKDDLGVVPIESVSIAADTVIKIVLQRSTIGLANVWYADKTYNSGNGCLRDSDSTVAHDNYEYIANSGMYSSANIASLVNKPYPLYNWCIAFKLPVNWSE